MDDLPGLAQPSRSIPNYGEHEYFLAVEARRPFKLDALLGKIVPRTVDIGKLKRDAIGDLTDMQHALSLLFYQQRGRT